MQDLHELPKLRDSLSYLYVEQAVLNQKNQAVEYICEEGRVMIPVAGLSVLLLGPGTSISHAAVKTLTENGCSVLWVGEESTRMYAQGTGETRRAYHLLRQARLASDESLRLKVVREMYKMRFSEQLDPALSLQQIRGKEGARVREAYTKLSLQYNVLWQGRNYDRGNWGKADPINRAISAANALLNGLCHAAIVSGGYSPGIGFIHTGKQLSFVYDIADLYKVDTTVPIAFEVVGEADHHVEKRVRERCREKFRETHLLKRILPDIDRLLSIDEQILPESQNVDADPACPEPLWNPTQDV